MILERVQRGLEQLYRLEPSPDVRDFIIDEARRQKLGLGRLPREQLLLLESAPGELEVGLFVDPRTLENLERNDPREGLGDHNLFDLCVAVEGVSHFVYLHFRASADVPLRNLELELQAEVDKYATCVLLSGGQPEPDLRERLFERFGLADDLSAEERERYQTANDQASRYARSLDARFVRERRIPDMLDELRRFYRMSQPEKLEHIAQGA